MRPRLGAYMVVVVVAGLPLAAWLVAALRTTTATVGAAGLVVLLVLLVVGELVPIVVARHGRQSDEITISSTVALAMLFVAPLGYAVLAQAIPLVVDDLRRGKHWSRPIFNIAQYALTLAASRWVFVTVSGQPFLQPDPFSPAALPAAFAAGATYFVVNHALVGTAVALFSGEPVLAHLRDDTRFQLGVSGLLICLAPVVAAVGTFSVWLVPVLMLPMAAVRNSARLAIQRHLDAMHDGLTGLPNRALVRSELVRALEPQAAASEGVTVMFIDLDHFKESAATSSPSSRASRATRRRAGPRPSSSPSASPPAWRSR
jgi:predicted signal transduction protein with EAL and GGDEF domain